MHDDVSKEGSLLNTLHSMEVVGTMTRGTGENLMLIYGGDLLRVKIQCLTCLVNPIVLKNLSILFTYIRCNT